MYCHIWPGPPYRSGLTRFFVQLLLRPHFSTGRRGCVVLRGNHRKPLHLHVSGHRPGKTNLINLWKTGARHRFSTGCLVLVVLGRERRQDAHVLQRRDVPGYRMAGYNLPQ